MEPTPTAAFRFEQFSALAVSVQDLLDRNK
jgi:hypothetical protein